MTVGYLFGAFDLLNVGDLDLVEQVRALSDRLVAVVYPDERVLVESGRAPVVPLSERVALLRHVRGVDEVVVLDEVALPEGAACFAAVGDRLVGPGAQRLSQRTTVSVLLRDALRGIRDDRRAEDVA